MKRFFLPVLGMASELEAHCGMSVNARTMFIGWVRTSYARTKTHEGRLASLVSSMNVLDWTAYGLTCKNTRD
jgi:hypothetical protein